MKLKGYFKKHKLKPTKWAIENNISPSIISRYLNNKTTMSKENAVKIEDATHGDVSILELLYPEVY